jgi:ABC-type branched-subunit amino acid transport system permease subunit
MNTVWAVYIATIAVYFLQYIMQAWGLNIQFGYAGILDFTYIVFFAIGGYVCGVLSLGRPVPGSQVSYILGFSWPFPLPLILGGAAAGVLGVFVGLVALRRLRSDYLGIVTFSIGFIAYDIVGNYTNLFDGFQGLYSVPQPGESALNLNPNSYTYAFIGLSFLVLVVLGFVTLRISASPLGRVLRAIREDRDQAEALGKNTFKYLMIAMVIGSIYGGLAGALSIEFVGALNPGGWTAPETFIIWATVIVGGRGNVLGSVIGALVLPTIFVEAARFLPVYGAHPIVFEALRNVIVGSLLILVLWIRPRGMVPERRRVFTDPRSAAVAGPAPMKAVS